MEVSQVKAVIGSGAASVWWVWEVRGGRIIATPRATLPRTGLKARSGLVWWPQPSLISPGMGSGRLSLLT